MLYGEDGLWSSCWHLEAQYKQSVLNVTLGEHAVVFSRFVRSVSQIIVDTPPNTQTKLSRHIRISADRVHRGLASPSKRIESILAEMYYITHLLTDERRLMEPTLNKD